VISEIPFMICII